jgi:nucleoside-diphosphate-sugar epimerase
VTTILVTGADGFLGRRLSCVLELCGYTVRRAVRSEQRGGAGVFATGDLATFSEWSALVRGVDVVVHLAARAHVLDKKSTAEVAAFRAVNVDATVRLARAAAARGVRRFVFVSSIGVNGNETFGRPFTEADVPAPREPYALSKLQAERELAGVQGSDGLEVVIVRPPLIYGPGVKGNLLRVLKVVSRGWPLPLGGLRRPRNFVGLDNLCDLLCQCVEHPGASGQVFLAAEPELRSTAELLEALSMAMGFEHRIWRWPGTLLAAGAALAGKRSEFAKLRSALEVDASKASSTLGWRPRVAFQDEIRATVNWFRGVPS